MTTRGAVAAEARAWLGTPYHERARLQGIGCDCVSLICAVFVAAGVRAELEPPPGYRTDFALHDSEELFLAWLEEVGARRVELARPGDIGVWRFGRAYSHGGVVVSDDGLVVHSCAGKGVILTRTTEEPLASRQAQFWTLLEGD